ncbi:hypothetical protein C8R45DRAFT_947406 [Mycena sanguinolenta]|nr:hypothetical protein C8R45DRAFT_947406 [Mycena sanguinolenta]
MLAFIALVCFLSIPIFLPGTNLDSAGVKQKLSAMHQTYSIIRLLRFRAQFGVGPGKFQSTLSSRTEEGARAAGTEGGASRSYSLETLKAVGIASRSEATAHLVVVIQRKSMLGLGSLIGHDVHRHVSRSSFYPPTTVDSTVPLYGSGAESRMPPQSNGWTFSGHLARAVIRASPRRHRQRPALRASAFSAIQITSKAD